MKARSGSTTDRARYWLAASLRPERGLLFGSPPTSRSPPPVACTKSPLTTRSLVELNRGHRHEVGHWYRQQARAERPDDVLLDDAI